MLVGFTGTQQGMNAAQCDRVWDGLHRLGRRVTLAVHGDCIGADMQFNMLCKSLNIPTACRPCNIRHKRANTNCPQLAPPKPPLERNEDIAASCDLLVVAPKAFEEELRSGTWSTVRRARKHGKRIVIVWPDGSVSRE